ncbi:tRNA dihydrouridine(20/20a) synthase DusA [Rhabdochromatium marinum]|nr:tRNA dihydrouridine(20/20a) synthase DusA [Rhabdochromatium marinum]
MTSLSPAPWKRPLSVAPMLDWTDRHFRFLARLISRHTWLYSEMVTTGALIHGDMERLLRFNPAEHPVALQLGGSEPAELAHCARLGADWGYDEINLNVGCPSDRVQNGRFGACLMAEPQRVADGVAAMKNAVSIPISVKTRIGIDHRDSYEELADFIARLLTAGCDLVILHARKAWLQGLSPRENRSVPPLRYDVALRLHADFPQLPLVLNGGITTLEQARHWCQSLSGVMMGREAYQNPWRLARADRDLFDDPHPLPSRHQVLEAFYPYVEDCLAAGIPLNSLSRHLLGLFNGCPGAKRWRRALSEQAHRPGVGVEVLRQAAALVDDDTQAVRETQPLAPTAA